MFGSSLPPVVCEGIMSYCIICVYLRVVSNTYCVVFCFSTSMLPVSQDCPFLIDPLYSLTFIV